jgi:hypothetical protein
VIINSDMAQGNTIQGAQASIVSRNSLIISFGVGAAVGFFGWLLTVALHNWVLSPIFCRSADTVSVCSNSGLTAWIIASIVVGIAGLLMLIQANVFRPLLVVLAAIITLWGVGLWFVPLAWWVGLLWQTGLFALAYALYTWLVSIEKFAYAMIAVVVVVVLMRLLFVY